MVDGVVIVVLALTGFRTAVCNAIPPAQVGCRSPTPSPTASAWASRVWVALHAARGRRREIHPLLWVVAALFLAYFAIGPITDLVART